MEENLTLIYINEFDPILTLTLLLERYSQMLNLKLPTDNTFYKTVWIWSNN